MFYFCKHKKKRNSSIKKISCVLLMCNYSKRNQFVYLINLYILLPRLAESKFQQNLDLFLQDTECLYIDVLPEHLECNIKP